jgi:hypothetical protein
MLAAFACGKPLDKKEKPAAIRGRIDPLSTETEKARTERNGTAGGASQKDEIGSLLRPSEVRLTPAQLTAAVDLTAEPVPLDPLPEGVTFEFRWFVEGKAVEEVSGPVLARNSYKKKQWVVCKARAIVEERSGPWQSSKHVRVANTPPLLASSPLEDFSVPGDLSYQISASDSDGDMLSYELVSPLDQDIILDPNTGLLTWKLEVDTVEKLGENIEIQFAVKDDEGQKTTGSITLHLIKQQR